MLLVDAFFLLCKDLVFAIFFNFCQKLKSKIFCQISRKNPKVNFKKDLFSSVSVLAYENKTLSLEIKERPFILEKNHNK